MSTGKIINDEILFGGGLDTDSDERFVQQGDYVDALNMIKVEDGENGVLVNIKGNEVVYTHSGAIDGKLCGWTYYDKNESLILFFYVEGVINGEIVEFNPQSGNSQNIATGSVLGFQDPTTNDYYIKADILGDWLAWTDNTNPPRMVNIQDIKDNSPTIDATYLDLHKVPPTASSTILPVVGANDKVGSVPAPTPVTLAVAVKVTVVVPLPPETPEISNPVKLFGVAVQSLST